MLPENNIRNFVIKILLCSFGLLFGVSILAPRAHLQNQSLPANTNAAANINAPTPRAKVKSSANTAGNTAAVTVPSIDNTPVIPMPTPPANSTIRGRVFYADTGRAVKRASIMLMEENLDDGPGSAPSALTDAEGYFQMRNVRAGTYYAMINAPGVVSPLAFFDFSSVRDGAGEREGFTKTFAGFDKIVVDGITSIDIQVPAYRGAAIGGRVMYDDGDPAIGIKVEIMRKVDDKFLSVIPNFSTMISLQMGGAFQTDDRGVYRFSGLPAGEYIVKVTENVWHGELNTKQYYDMFDRSGESSFLTIFFPDVLDTKSAQIIEVAAGQEMSEINLTIPSRALYKLEGKIIAAKDKSPVKARVVVSKEADNTFSIFTRQSKREQSTMTDENGNWKFKELPKGTYKIVVEPIESESTYQSYLGNYSNMNSMVRAEKNLPPPPKLAKKAQEVTIEDKDLSEIVVELGYGATVSGTVVVENSREMPKSVTIRASNETDKLVVLDSVSNYYGDYTPKPEKSEHDFKLENVTVGKNRLLVNIDDDNFYLKSVTVNGIDLIANPVEIKEGDVLRNVQIVLSNGVGTLKGTVSNVEKEPVKGAALSFAPVDVAKRKNPSFYRSVKTDKNGEFEIKMAPGEYAIVIFDGSVDTDKFEEFLKWLDTAVKSAQKVKIEAGKTETVSIKNFK